MYCKKSISLESNIFFWNPILRFLTVIFSLTFQVWLDREIFEEEYVQELRDALDKQKLQAAQNAKIVERFKPSEMTEKIKEMMKREEENEKRLKTLKLVKVDVSSPEAIQQIKGKQLTQGYIPF